MKYLLLIISVLFLFSCGKDPVFDPENPTKADFYGNWQHIENTCSSSSGCISFDEEFMRYDDGCDGVSSWPYEWRILGSKIYQSDIGSSLEVDAVFVFESENLLRITNNNGCHTLSERL